MFERPLTPASSDSSMAVSDVRSVENLISRGALKTALHVIRTERDALTALEDLYETDVVAQDGLANAVNAISKSVRYGGKLVISGIGKSGKICEKCVATMNSFGIRSVFLHPTEALHGDLGTIGEVSCSSTSKGVLGPDYCNRMIHCFSSPSLDEPQRSLLFCHTYRARCHLSQ